MGGRIQNYIILMEEKMNTDANKTIDFEKKLKEKLGKELKKEIENGNYDEIIDYILSAYSEGLNIFYKEGVKSFFEEFEEDDDVIGLDELDDVLFELQEDSPPKREATPTNDNKILFTFFIFPS